MDKPLHKLSGESSRTQLQELPKHTLEEPVIAVGSLVNECASRTSTSGENSMCAIQLGLRRQPTKELQRDRNVYWKAIAEETERSVACDDTR